MDMKSTGFTDQLTWKNDQHTVVGGIEYYKDEIPIFTLMVQSVEHKGITLLTQLSISRMTGKLPISGMSLLVFVLTIILPLAITPHLLSL